MTVALNDEEVAGLRREVTHAPADVHDLLIELIASLDEPLAEARCGAPIRGHVAHG